MAEIAALRSIIPAFAGKRIVVLGDLMLDHYLIGEAERISPEAPVPVLAVQSERSFPGGAANVALCLHALGAEAVPCGLIGCDADGAALAEIFQSCGLDASFLVGSTERRTTKKTRLVAGRQQIARVDHEERSPCGAAIIGEAIRAFDRAFRGHGQKPTDAVIISDYGKGFILPPLIAHVIMRCREASVPLAVDPKLEFFKYYRGVTLITPNSREAAECAGLRIRDTPSLLAVGDAIRALLDPDILLITLSEHGMALFERGQDLVEIPTRAREVYDVTGAGDMVIAVAALALASGAGAREAALLANTAAGLEVQKFGCQTITPAELLAALDSES
ncbi:MAG: PfkB family carbohydrate kinase [Spirochaetota bacterium]|jgi:D-beta-D-heptose 7-phosphate kinase/D-beta-D-heptose 1-phosphate adenosyltransferase|nr:PfkB family carbohydrate kinase [Spirochaetota bacterium]